MSLGTTQRGSRFCAATHSGSDIGSALSVIFTDQTWRVVVGHSKGDRVWKFPCGKIEKQDHPQYTTCTKPRFEILAAKRCALRELEAEIGLNEKHLSFFHQLKYVRAWTSRSRTTCEQKELRQFHFLGIMSEGVMLPKHVEEEEEMDVRSYWSIGEVFKKAMQPPRTENKFNPFHAIALAESIIFLRNMIGEDLPFAMFHEKLRELEKGGVHLDTIVYELDDQIKTRQI